MEASDQTQSITHSRGTDVSQITARIGELARSGAFKKAEQLRQQLMETNPMAIDSIIGSAEIIEKEKIKRLDDEHIDLWPELYEALSDEETTCLFHCLKQTRLKAGKLLVVQGRSNNNLFFIEHGTVTLFYQKKQKNIAAAQLKKGNILGEDSFFGFSLCPFSAVTKEDTVIRHLSRQHADAWLEDQPHLYSKLAEYCKKYGLGEVTAEQKSSSMREHRRYPVAGSATAYILDENRQKTSVYFRGELIDMSQSGLCFSIRCSRQENARALLQKMIDAVIVFDDFKDKKFQFSGTIVKLSYHLHNDYFVHVQLSEMIAIDQFKAFPCDWSSKEQS